MPLYIVLKWPIIIYATGMQLDNSFVLDNMYLFLIKPIGSF